MGAHATARIAGEDYQYNHHFVWLGANQRTNKWCALGEPGLKPNGTCYPTGMEPWFAWVRNPRRAK